MFGLIHTYIHTYIHTLTCCFCTVGCLLLLHFILFRSKLEYALPAWNVTTSNGSNLECVKWKFAAPSLIHFSLISLTVMLLHLSCCSYTLHKWQGANLIISFLLFMYFQALNFILPWLLILVSKFLFVILDISPSFLQDKNCPSTRCCKFGMQWYRYRYAE